MNYTSLKWLSLFGVATFLLAVAPHANASAETTANFSSETTEKYAENTLVVNYSSAIPYKEIQALHGRIIQQIPELESVVLHFPSQQAMQKATDWLTTSGRVKKISLSPSYHPTATTDVKNSLQYTHQLLHTEQAFKLSKGKKIKIAVIDSGVDSTHLELRGKIIKALNVVDPMKSPVKMAHGTHVAGIIAAAMNNEVGGHGIYPSAQILSYDVFNGTNTSYDYDIAQAILHAITDDAKVINLSLGGYGESTLVTAAINKAYSKGITVIAAAGNDRSSEKFQPASLPHVISVGSVNSKNKRSDYSNFGYSLDLMAPGERIYSTSYIATRGSSYEYMSGTSMASPVVAAVSAMLLSKNGALSPDKLEYILEHTTTDIHSKGYDSTTGYGVVNAINALNYPLKKVPSLKSSQLKNEEIQKKAALLVPSQTTSGILLTPNEYSWHKIVIKKGQYVQAQAFSEKNSDIKLIFKMLGNTLKTKSIDDVGAGKLEASYMKATEDGYIAIGVNDVNGRINNSYSLTASVYDKAPIDDTSVEQPIEITNGQGKIKNLTMFSKDDSVDEDVFHFTAVADQIVQVSTTALAGVDLSIDVYKKEDLLGEGQNGPIVSINKNTIGQAEYASFPVKKDQEYEVIVSNSPNSSALSTLDFFNQLEDGLAKPHFSFLPYDVKFTTKSIPSDEDGLYFDTESLNKVYVGAPKKNYALHTLFKKYGHAFDFKKGATAYLQSSNDIDGYYFKATSSALYQFNTTVKHAAEQPALTLYEVITDPLSGEQIDQFVASNSTEDGIMKPHLLASLKGNKTYLLEASIGSIGSISQNGYKITATCIKEHIEDAFETNDTPEQAKPIKVNQKITANFSKLNDVDFYYFKATKNTLYRLQMKNTTFNDSAFSYEWRNNYTKSVTVYEDINNNHTLDANELATYKALPIDLTGLPVNGSIEAKKGQAFFINASPTGFMTTDSFSIYPYHLSIQEAVVHDEDATNRIIKNTPSKPVKLKKSSSTTYEQSGYMNPGILNGDTDWYSFIAPKTKTAKITLTVPDEMDAIISVYSKGKLLRKIDDYGVGDMEITKMKFKKNTPYYFKVTDHEGNAFVEPYKLTIHL